MFVEDSRRTGVQIPAGPLQLLLASLSLLFIKLISLSLPFCVFFEQGVDLLVCEVCDSEVG